MAREFKYTGRFRERGDPRDFGPPPTRYSGPQPDKSKAHDFQCPALWDKGPCDCREAEHE